MSGRDRPNADVQHLKARSRRADVPSREATASRNRLKLQVRSSGALGLSRCTPLLCDVAVGFVHDDVSKGFDLQYVIEGHCDLLCLGVSKLT